MCVKCFNIDVRIYSTLLLLRFFFCFFVVVFFFGRGILAFCHFDIDVCIYIVLKKKKKRIINQILMLIMYSAVNM